MTTDAWTAIGLAAAGYLCGAVPFGLLIGRMRGVDVRTRGSGNIGATNVGRVVGRPYGAAVFVLDGLKGFLPVTAARWAVSESGGAAWPYVVWTVVATACVLGHSYPVWLRFKGGKGVATSLGAGLAVYPYYTGAALAALAVWGVVLAATRYVSAASIVAAVAFPVIFAAWAWVRREAWGGPAELWPLYAFGAAVAALVVWRHRGNIGRLREGRERRVGDDSHGGGN